MTPVFRWTQFRDLVAVIVCLDRTQTGRPASYSLCSRSMTSHTFYIHYRWVWLSGGASTELTGSNPPVPLWMKALDLMAGGVLQEHGAQEITIVSPAQFPDRSVVSEYREPMVLGTIIAPDDYTSKIMSLCQVCLYVASSERTGTCMLVSLEHS